MSYKRNLIKRLLPIQQSLNTTVAQYRFTVHHNVSVNSAPIRVGLFFLSPFVFSCCCLSSSASTVWSFASLSARFASLLGDGSTTGNLSRFSVVPENKVSVCTEQIPMSRPQQGHINVSAEAKGH